MIQLDMNRKYLVLINSNDVIPESLSGKLKEADIEAVVMGIPSLPGQIEFYELIKTVPAVP